VASDTSQSRIPAIIQWAGLPVLFVSKTIWQARGDVKASPAGNMDSAEVSAESAQPGLAALHVTEH
jgi:hypothetical protein